MQIEEAPTPWHDGEIRLQRSVGMAERMAQVGPRVIRSAMPDQHRTFFAQLPFLMLGSVDDAGDVWATVASGMPGFAGSPDPASLRLQWAPAADDPAGAGMGQGAAVAVLGIEPQTRRRNRMNGHVVARDAGSLTIGVEQSFGNCPRYMRVREPAILGVRQPGPVRWLAPADMRVRAMVGAADTFFVASYAPLPGGRQADVSHRGGPAGFVRVAADGLLTVPDYAGNMFFNTLGNLVANPRAGLAFVDFETGDLLQMTGHAEVLPDGTDVSAYPGAERLWTFRPERVVLREGAVPLRWRAAA